MGCSGSKDYAYPNEYPMHMAPEYAYANTYVQQDPMCVMQQPQVSGNGHLASEAFLADWAQFLHSQPPEPFVKSINVDHTVFPVHEAGRDWAEQTLARMHSDIEDLGIGGDYNYDQNGDETSGEIVIECKTLNRDGPNTMRNMTWKLIYSLVPPGSQPSAAMGNYPAMPQSPMGNYPAMPQSPMGNYPAMPPMGNYPAMPPMGAGYAPPQYGY